QFSSEANIKLSIESIGAIERFKDDVGQETDFHQDGYLFLLSEPANVQAFQRNVALQKRLGVDVQWLTPDDAARLTPGLRTDGVTGATFCQKDGIADPNGITMGFAKAAQALGVEIVRETEVTGVRVQAGRIQGVDTSRGAVDAPIVVNAAGPYARRIGDMIGVDTPVTPVRHHIFIAQPASRTADNPSAFPGAPSNHLMVIDFETTFYFHREGANLLFGMADREEQPGFDLSVNWEFLERVTPIAVRRLPALADASISHAWAGLYEMTPDAMPIIGPAGEPDGYYMITGFSGHGFQHSPAAGRILADVIAGRDPQFDLSPFAYARFAKGETEREANVV
ncbi:MAG TPA: FAD-binding oxidoreductase, partial [Thermomicrobiales bacterium]|nr:FAD-binding oxidoreductase [Thermomicrobiales bacterium]